MIKILVNVALLLLGFVAYMIRRVILRRPRP